MELDEGDKKYVKNVAKAIFAFQVIGAVGVLTFLIMFFSSGINDFDKMAERMDKEASEFKKSKNERLENFYKKREETRDEILNNPSKSQ